MPRPRHPAAPTAPRRPPAGVHTSSTITIDRIVKERAPTDAAGRGDSTPVGVRSRRPIAHHRIRRRPRHGSVILPRACRPVAVAPLHARQELSYRHPGRGQQPAGKIRREDRAGRTGLLRRGMLAGLALDAIEWPTRGPGIVGELAMSTILDEIVTTKRREVAAAKLRMPLEEMEDQAAMAPPVRDFRAALAGPGPIQTHRRGQEGEPVGPGDPGRLRPDRDREDRTRPMARPASAC